MLETFSPLLKGRIYLKACLVKTFGYALEMALEMKNFDKASRSLYGCLGTARMSLRALKVSTLDLRRLLNSFLCEDFACMALMRLNLELLVKAYLEFLLILEEGFLRILALLLRLLGC
jgi:DNA phosphorothioation-dependent restriction protein DptG